MIGFMRFGRTHSTIALDVGPASVALCQLTRRRGGVALHRWGVLEDPLRSRLETDDICASAAERTARFVRQTGFRGRAATLVLRPPDVTFHAVTLPDALSAAPAAQRQTMLQFEAARQIQATPEEIQADYWPLPPGNRSGTNAIIVAARRTVLDGWLDFFNVIGLEPSRIDVSPCALLRCAWRSGLPGNRGERSVGECLWGMLDIGYSDALLAIALGSQCIYVRTLPIGGDAFTTAIAKMLKVDYGVGETLKRRYIPPGATQPSQEQQDSPADSRCYKGTTGPSREAAGADLDELGGAVHTVVRGRLRALAVDIERAFSYAMESYPEATPVGLYVCGGGARLTQLPEALQKLLGVEVVVLNPCARVTPRPSAPPVPEVHFPNLAACVGLALGDIE